VRRREAETGGSGCVGDCCVVKVVKTEIGVREGKGGQEKAREAYNGALDVNITTRTR